MKYYFSTLSILALLTVAILSGAGLGAYAQAQGVSGLPLPRFVSLRAGEVNMRTGPGVQYPVEWVYTRKDLPVEIIAEFETWRKVRDWEGTQGWVHQSMLSGKRTVLITGDVRSLRIKDDAKSSTRARVEPGVIGRLVDCPRGNGWCRIEVAGLEGWLRHVDFWGAYKNEVFD